MEASCNAYVCGSTTSPNFPVTQGAYRRVYGGSSPALDTMPAFGDGFVAKIDPTATTLLYSTYLGGRQDDLASGIAID